MDATNKSLPISAILKNQETSISKLYKQGLAIRELDQKLKTYLDSSLRQHFELANINNDIAVLLVNSSAWATRLRYNIPAILSAFNSHLDLNSIKTIRIKINKPVLNKPEPKKNSNYLSDETAKFLNESAKNFNHPELRQCLEKLSKHHL